MSETSITTIDQDFVQAFAFIHHGGSGSPVLNEAGEIISVVSRGAGLDQHQVPELIRTRPTRLLNVEHFGEAATAAAQRYM